VKRRPFAENLFSVSVFSPLMLKRSAQPITTAERTDPKPLQKQLNEMFFTHEFVGHGSSLGFQISGLLGVWQKKGRKILNNIDKRARIYGNFLNKRNPLLLFRRVAGEG
jgi:hypothetical protein